MTRPPAAEPFTSFRLTPSLRASRRVAGPAAAGGPSDFDPVTAAVGAKGAAIFAAGAATGVVAAGATAVGAAGAGAEDFAAGALALDVALIVSSNSPIGILTPGFTCTAIIVPACGQVISATALSVSTSQTTAPLAIVSPTFTATDATSTFVTPSDTSGNRKSTGPDATEAAAGALAVGAGAAATGAGAGVVAAGAGFAADATGAEAPLVSISRIGCPTLILSPDLIRTFVIVPACGHAISATALSVSTSQMIAPDAMTSPSLTRTSATSTEVTPSDTSGSLNSRDIGVFSSQCSVFSVQ